MFCWEAKSFQHFLFKNLLQCRTQKQQNKHTLFASACLLWVLETKILCPFFANWFLSWAAGVTAEFVLTAGNLTFLSNTFSLCKPVEDKYALSDMLDWLAVIIGKVAMVNYPYPASFLQPLPAWPVTVSTLSVCLSVCLPVCPSVCPSVCLSVSVGQGGHGQLPLPCQFPATSACLASHRQHTS